MRTLAEIIMKIENHQQMYMGILAMTFHRTEWESTSRGPGNRGPPSLLDPHCTWPSLSIISAVHAYRPICAACEFRARMPLAPRTIYVMFDTSRVASTPSNQSGERMPGKLNQY